MDQGFRRFARKKGKDGKSFEINYLCTLSLW